jgi:hypothetical protein
MKPRVTRELQAQRATVALTHAAEWLQTMLPDLTIVVLAAQVASDEGDVNVGVSWPPDLKADAAAVAREAAEIFEKQAQHGL